MEQDWMIYNHFVDVFDRKVNDFGRERMKREVEKLEIENSKLFDKCVNATKYEEQVKNQKTKTPRIEEFILKDGAGANCQDHVRKELPYLYKVNQKQEKLLKLKNES